MRETLQEALVLNLGPCISYQGFFERAWEAGDMFVARWLGNIYLKIQLGVI